MELPTSDRITAAIDHWQETSNNYARSCDWGLSASCEKKIESLKRDLRMARIEEKLDELLTLSRITQK